MTDGSRPRDIKSLRFIQDQKSTIRNWRESLIKYYLIAPIANDMQCRTILVRSRNKKGRFRSVEQRAVSPFRVIPSSLRYQYNLRNTSSTWDVFLSLHTSFVISLRTDTNRSTLWVGDRYSFLSPFLSFFLSLLVSQPLICKSHRRAFECNSLPRIRKRVTLFFFFFYS